MPRLVDKVNIGASAVLEHLGEREWLGNRLELADVMDAIRQACKLCHCAVEGYFDPLLVISTFRGDRSICAVA